MEPQTIKQLDEWMTANCYNDSYAIAHRSIYEGLGLDKVGDLFVWYYTERGERTNLNYFVTEKEAVAFAFNQIKEDEYARRHMIGFVDGNILEEKLLNELKNRGIPYWKDEILYRVNDMRTRVFVFGCDVNKVLDLQDEYGYKSKF